MEQPPVKRRVWWERRSRYWVVLLLVGFCAWAEILWQGRRGGQTEDIRIFEGWKCDAEKTVRSVAIIGAGSGGASAAYYLNKFSKPCAHLNITVYERSDYVGGRSTTVNAYNDPAEPVELGASIFVKVNRNLVSAAEEFGLTTQGLGANDVEHLPRTLGVYNGEKWVFRGSQNRWWTTFKILWKYGMAPIKTQRLMKQTTGRFFKMYDPPVFPSKDLSQTVFEVGLTDVTAVTGEQYLSKNNIGTAFADDIIQASTRVNYAQNLDQIHGLEAMVCMATDGAMSVRGGNWQIFSNMLKVSGANVLLRTPVSSISRQENGTYTIHALQNNSSPHLISHDTVIIAAPLQFSNISLTPAPLHPPPAIPYVQLHVTLFTSPFTLRPDSFNLHASDTPPTTILTTKPPSHTQSLPYYSISTLRILRNPATGSTEYLYKIFSPAPLPQSYIHSLLLQQPTYPKTKLNPNPSPSSSRNPISWHHTKTWHSYPYMHPRVTFEDVQLDQEGRVWYTSGIESFISTMETSSLMGGNVAALVVEGWRGEDGGLGEGRVDEEMGMGGGEGKGERGEERSASEL